MPGYGPSPVVPKGSLPPATTPNFINNQWLGDRGTANISVVHAATEEVLATLPEASNMTVDLAFEAAARAFPEWSAKSGAARAAVLKAIAAKLKQNYDEIALLESHMGKPLAESKWDVDDVIYCFEYYAGKAEAFDAQQDAPISVPDADYTCRLRHEPMGVCALIVPWNYPLLMAAWKIAPCLASGCTCVIKPSELSQIMMEALSTEVGPAG